MYINSLIFFAPNGAGVNEEPTIPKNSGEELDEVKITEFLNIIHDTQLID
jgi:hypothetical protein